MSLFDIQKSKIDTTNTLTKVCEINSYLSKLEFTVNFFNSDDWETMKSSLSETQYHNFAKNFIETNIGNKGFLFLSESESCSDPRYNNLTNDEKNFLKSIDSAKKKGLWKYGRFLFQYIGSSFVSPAVLAPTGIGEIFIDPPTPPIPPPM